MRDSGRGSEAWWSSARFGCCVEDFHLFAALLSLPLSVFLSLTAHRQSSSSGLMADDRGKDIDTTEKTSLLVERIARPTTPWKTLQNAVATSCFAMVFMLMLWCGLATESMAILPSASSINAQNSQHYPHVIEMAQFQLIDGIDVDDFLKYANSLAPFFLQTHDALQRSLVFNIETGIWSDLVYWTSLPAALQAAQDIMVWPGAQLFLSCINATTLVLSHSSIHIDSTFFPKPQHGLHVEIAVFPLNTGVKDSGFVQDAAATTSFFSDLHTAQRRILAQGHEDDTIWYDLVYWNSVVDAMQAAKLIEHCPAARPFLDAINTTSDSFAFTYSQVMLQQVFFASH